MVEVTVLPPLVMVVTLAPPAAPPPVPVATPLRPGPVAVPDSVRAGAADLVRLAGQEAETSQRVNWGCRRGLGLPAAQ